MKTFINPAFDEWQQIIQRPVVNFDAIDAVVSGIIRRVALDGDAALKQLTAELDGWTATTFLTAGEEYSNASQLTADSLKDAIATAKANIETFHAAQKEQVKKIETTEGVLCWRKSIPIQRVGLYIPGGSAPLISTLLMLGVPARIAGCKEVVVCSPAKDGLLHPALLYTAKLLGINQIYKVGGAQAIAAMAFGTESVPRVDKIFGPGNLFVTRAKQMVHQAGVDIDMPAGPSEVAIYADQTCRPAFVAADILSQAEHGTDSQALLVAASPEILQEVMAEIEKQKIHLPRIKEVEASLSNSRFVVMDEVSAGFDLLNSYAPEHLIIASDAADELADWVIHAGSVFLGHYSPESAGDYASGTNHTLPTQGFAKTYSGLSVDSFVRKMTFQHLTPEGLQNLAPVITELAAAEGLEAHKNAVLQRLQR